MIQLLANVKSHAEGKKGVVTVFLYLKERTLSILNFSSSSITN